MLVHQGFLNVSKLDACIYLYLSEDAMMDSGHLVLFIVFTHYKSQVINAYTPPPTLPPPRFTSHPTSNLTSSPTPSPSFQTGKPSISITESFSITDLSTDNEDDFESPTYSYNYYNVDVGETVMIAVLVGVFCFFIGICTKSVVDQYRNKRKHSKHERMDLYLAGSGKSPGGKCFSLCSFMNSSPKLFNSIGERKTVVGICREVYMSLDIDFEIS